MIDARWVCGFFLVALGLGPWVPRCSGMATERGPGLTVRADGILLKDGQPYRAIGVNYFDAFARVLQDPNDTSYEAGFRILAAQGIPFARFMGTGFWPAEMKLYLADKARYFRLLDGVVRAAEKHGLGLMPSLFWQMALVPDLVHEPCDQWGNPGSKTHEFMRTYTRELVTRYRDSPALWGWEFGNEFNLLADLPNAREHLPAVWLPFGTPATRSDRDILTHAMVRTAFREFAREVRRHDPYRMISTGNSIPRPSAWHQMHEGTWTNDAPAQFAEMLAGDHPDPSDTISIHLYEPATDRLTQAIQVAGKQHKTLFIGEFGVPGEGSEAQQQFQALLNLIERTEVPLAALWVFDYKHQADRNVTADNSRSYQLQTIAEANRRLQDSSASAPPSGEPSPRPTALRLPLEPSPPPAAEGRPAAGYCDISAETLRDKMRGGLLGQLLGNLNGLPHEMKYIAEPGKVLTYAPALPEGAWTDDDTDFEWVYIKVMQDENCLLLPPPRIRRLWQERINRRIWCANQYARQLMDLGIEPPLTGMSVFNPWADFNVSGQFLCETFGLLAPALPQSAARLGLNYTHVAIDGEPAQVTQLFTSMIALAFVTDDIESLLASGLSAVDPNSTVSQIIRDVCGWYREHPDDWRITRQLLKEKYSKHGGEMRDRNGYELNTGSTIAALLYGRGDFVPTLVTAFNFGWDADNTAATAGTVVGVLKGYRWMLAQGWQVVDRYKNTTRENMPDDETITSFADRLTDLAEKLILEQGGGRRVENGRIIYRTAAQKPGCVEHLENPGTQAAALQAQLRSEIEDSIAHPASRESQARAAYYAICLGLAPSLRAQHPGQWADALAALSAYEKVVQALFHHSPTPLGDGLREKAAAAGLQKPATGKALW